MNWTPKIIKIEVNENYKDGISTATFTSTPFYYWNGYKYYKWLWFKWRRKLYEGKHFDIFNNQLKFKFIIPSGIECIITYTKLINEMNVW